MSDDYQDIWKETVMAEAAEEITITPIYSERKYDAASYEDMIGAAAQLDYVNDGDIIHHITASLRTEPNLSEVKRANIAASSYTKDAENRQKLSTIEAMAELVFAPDLPQTKPSEVFICMTDEASDELHQNSPERVGLSVRLGSTLLAAQQHLHNVLIPQAIEETNLLGGETRTGVIFDQINVSDGRWTLGVGVDVEEDGKVNTPFVYVTDGKETYAEVGYRTVKIKTPEGYNVKREIAVWEGANDLPDGINGILNHLATNLDSMENLQQEITSGKVSERYEEAQRRSAEKDATLKTGHAARIDKEREEGKEQEGGHSVG